MAQFYRSMEELKKLEYNRASNVLHHNSGEKGYTYYGIYQKAHPTWQGWSQICKMVLKYNRLKTASAALYKDKSLTQKVYKFYRQNYWNVTHLDMLISQKMADEIFVFSVNTNPKRAVKKAQKIIGAEVDGWMGNKTISKLNAYDESKFDIQFDLAEIAFYKFLAFFSKRKSQHRQFYDGWVNRARAV